MAADNVSFSVTRISWGSDDAVGGAVVTGSVVYACVWGWMAENKPAQESLDQGIEIHKTASILIREYGASTVPYNIVERDEIKVTGPAEHEYIGKQFRVMSVEHMPTHPRHRNRQMRLTVSRFERGRSEEWV